MLKRASSVEPQPVTPASWGTRNEPPNRPGTKGGAAVRPCGPAEVADLAAFEPQESTLLDHWLSTKLRAPKDTKLPNQRQTVGELVTKTMVAEAFLKKSKHASTVRGPGVQQPHAATHRGRRPPTCHRLGPQGSLRRLGPQARLQ